MLHMVQSFKALYQNVIYINFYGFANEISKNFVDKPLIGGPNILYAKRYHLIAIKASICNE